ncbi:Early nodulin-like protein [Thalictrum thalictroides]|uniref:Early nodulin-like protein n=1 Tax=Thalictrum thalictroides TaxID=46969 RepID=A0A7J6V2C0_THATH|nr:Early nodulin-like protein [Thalictrum thalictroides]
MMAKAMEISFMMVMAMVVIISMSIDGGKMVQAQVHHVVGGDRGWDLNSDLKSWSSNRFFRVGDNIWFSYSGPQESISELRTKEEFESCDITNPIKMYTDGVNKVDLNGEGIRYFVSSKPENCKNGLKLHVEVLPKSQPQSQPNILYVSDLAAGPTPFGSASLLGPRLLSILVGCALVLANILGLVC